MRLNGNGLVPTNPYDVKTERMSGDILLNGVGGDPLE